MPLYSFHDLQPKGWYKNGHYNTFIPYLFGHTPDVPYERVRLITPDDDFLDVDTVLAKNPRLIVLCHGLEGSSKSSYILHFAGHFIERKWDILSINYRGCSGEMNRNLRMYNSGTTDDLHFVLEKFAGFYDEIALIGFSLGGNLVLKYLGEKIHPYPANILSAVALSSPVHLSDASQQLLKWDNFAYQLKFLWSLNRKLIQKNRQHPRQIALRKIFYTWNLYQFDDRFIAPIYGYRDAEDYYKQNQSIQWLDRLEVPSLLVNALDDPFLGPKCYPIQSAKGLDNFFICTPRFGGHVGFAFDKNDRSWMLKVTESFIENNN